ncbi:MAG: FHA domain-containing protein [Deltaproteobacteria bacterium]|nr:FHA domain-containing protein [Deltaproteobacteria bacterium]
MYKLIIEDDEGKTTVVPLVRDEISIGRKEGNTIRLTERNVSRFHAKIVRNDGQVLIEDLDSYNGVKVNGDRISGKSSVKEGDVIEIGDYHLQLREESDLVPVGEHAEDTGRYSMEELARQTRDDITPVKAGRLPEPMPVVEPAAPPPRAVPVGGGDTAVVRIPEAGVPAAREEEGLPVAGTTARLVVIGQQFQGREFALNRTSMHIGRSDDNDIAIDHRSISKNHAKVILENDTYKIIDLKSANGVLVNGEQYAKTELKSGDIVELGHIKFRFVDRSDAEGYSPETQHTAVIRIPSKPAAKAAAMAEAVEAEALERTEVTAIPAAPRGRIGIIIGVAAVVLIGGAAGVYFGFLKDRGAPGGGTYDRSPVQGPIKKLLDEAKAYKEVAKWSEARNKAEQAQVMDPNNPEVRSLLAELGAEESNKTLYDQAKAAATLNSWDEAWKKMNQVSRDSYYYKHAIKELPTIKEKIMQTHFDAGSDLLRSREFRKAIAEFNVVLDLDDQHAGALAGKRQAEQGGGGPGPAPGRPVAQKEDRAPRPPREKETLPAPTPAPAAPAEMSHIDYYNEGNKLYLQNRIVEAVAMFQKCIKANNRYPQCHRSLGICYAKLGQGDKAAREYKIYLQLAPDAPDRKQLEQIIGDFEKTK